MSTIATLDAPAPLRAEQQITVEFETIDRARARLYLDRNDENRALRGTAVESYARDLREGNWLTTGEALKFDWDGRLIDGQHRLAAIERAGVEIPMLVIRGLDPRVQRVIDTNVRRTAGDALRLIGVEGNIYAIASMARLAIVREAGQLNVYGSIKYAVSHAAILDWVAGHEESHDIVKRAVRIAQRIGTGPSPLAYCIWRLEQISVDDTALFFESMATYATDGQGDPRLALLRLFQDENRLAVTRNQGTVIGVTFTAWNAWRDKQKLTSLPIVDSKGRQLRIPEPV